MSKKLIKFTAWILCVTFCLCLIPSCDKADPLTPSGITSILLDPKKESVTASVALDANLLQKHKGQYVFLYELMPGEKTSVLASRDPLDYTKIKPSMRFSFDLMDGERTRLYSSFVLCFEDGTFLSHKGTYIENPRTLATDKAPFAWSSTPKGLHPVDPSDAAALGAWHAMYEISVSRLIGGTDSHTFLGEGYPYSSEALSALDAAILPATRAGLQVSLTVKVDTPLSQKQAAAYFDLLASRYNGGESGAVTAFFVDVSDEAAEESAMLCRFASLALRSRFANGRVYALSDARTLTDAKLFFTTLQSAIQTGGSFEWGAAVRPVGFSADADSENDSENTTDDSEKNSEQASTETAAPLTFDALPSLSTYLFSSASDGRASHLAVCDLSFSAADPDLQAAQLAYAYRASLAAKANLIFYSSHMGDENGLYDTIMEPHRALSVFASIDTGLSETDLSLCRSVFSDRWDALGSEKPTRRLQTGHATVGSGSFAENPLFDFTTSETYGFTGVGSVTDPISRNSSHFRSPVLYTWIEPTFGNAGGVRKVMADGSALSGAVSLSATLLTQIPNAEACTAYLRLDGVTPNGSALTYESSVEIRNGAWQTVTFQIAGFVSAADLSAPCTLTLTTEPDHETDAEYVLWIHSMNVRQPAADNGILIPALLILGGVLLGFLGMFVLYHKTSMKKNRRR